MRLEITMDAPTILFRETAALALRRLAGRLVDPAIIKISGAEPNRSFLERHHPAIVPHAKNAVKCACLALEFAFRNGNSIAQVEGRLPCELNDGACQQARRLRETFAEAGLGENPASDLTAMGEALALLRQDATARDDEDCFGGVDLKSSATDPEADEDLAAVQSLVQELAQSDYAPLAELLLCRTRYGELLAVALTDYFLCRALQSDAHLGQEFMFVHLEQAAELWKDDLGMLAEFVEKHVATAAVSAHCPLETASDGLAVHRHDEEKDEELERQFKLGLDRYLIADYEGAIRFFTAALRLDPRSAPLYAYRGDCHRLLCEYDRAITDYSAALKLNPASACILVQRATACRLRGDLPHAVEDATAALALDPRHIAAYTCRADARLAQGALDEAIADYKVAIELRPPTVWAQLGRGAAHLRKGNYDAAIVDFTHVLSVDPHQVSAQLQRGDACRQKGDLAQAIVDYTEVLRHHPRNALAYRHRALAHEVNGDSARAILDYSRVLRIDAADAASRCSRGILFRRHGKLARARADLDEALRLAPTNETALYHRARVSLARGQFHEALADLDLALDRNPNHVAGYLARALVHDRLRQFPQGIQNCGRALLLDQRCAAAWLIRGVISSHAGGHAQAIADLTEAIALDPAFPPAHQERGAAHVLAGDLNAAFADFTRLIELTPRSAVAYANRGIVCQLRGEHEAALGDFAHALRLDPQCLLAGFHQNLSDSVRDKTTWLYTDYAEGLRPAPRRAAASRPAVQRRPAEIDSAPHPGTVTAAQAPPSDAGASVGAPTVVLVSPARKTGVEVRGPVQETPERSEPEVVQTQTAAPAAVTMVATPVLPPAEEKAAQEVLSLDEPPAPSAPDEQTAAAPPPAAPTLPPLQCPLCREIAVPAERLDGGRVRCSNCKAVFMPTAASFLAAAPKTVSSTSAKALLNKYKTKRPARGDDDGGEPRFTRRQKLAGAAAAAVILLIAGYFFLPSFGGAGGNAAITTSVGADELLRDFTVNKANAAKKYTLGYVVVSGEVAEVYRDKRPRVRFKGEAKAKSFVEAVFTHPSDLKEIEKGHKLTVRGECEGWQKNVVEITLCKAVTQ